LKTLNYYELDKAFQKKKSIDDFDEILTHYIVPRSLLEKYSSKFKKRNWKNISCFQILNYTFMKKFFKKLDIISIIEYQTLTEDLILKIINSRSHMFEHYFEEILTHQKISESFMLSFLERIDSYSSENKKEKMKNKFFKIVSRYQDLSEEFIFKNNLRVHWRYISKFQKLTEKIILKNLDKIDYDYFCDNQSIEKSVFEETLPIVKTTKKILM
jgi:hypothetical protein